MDRIKRIIAGIGGMVERWNDPAEVSSIERDIVLARIRELYEEVLAFDTDKAAMEPQPIAAVPQSGICPGVSIDIEEIAKELSPEAPEFNDAISPEEPVEGFTDIKPETDAVSAKRDEEAGRPKRLDRDLIMSLYCEQSTTDLKTGIHEESSIEITATEGVVPSNMEEQDAPPAGERPEPVSAEWPVSKILGEILGDGNKRLSDILSENGGAVVDVASKICAQQTVGLRKSIGVNDRFLLIRDLFDSDAVLYDATINKLEEFADLNDALLYIYENYSWDPNSDAVKLLIGLLTRKLS